jgi:hypothetical protein
MATMKLGNRCHIITFIISFDNHVKFTGHTLPPNKIIS